MTIDTNRAAFVQRSHEFHVFDDVDVKTVYPDAREVTVETNAVSTRASVVANDIMTDCANYRTGIEIVIDQVLSEDDFKNQNVQYTLIYPRLNINRVVRVVSFSTDWLGGQTRLVLK